MANSIMRMFTPSNSDNSGMVQPMPEPISTPAAEAAAEADLKKKKRQIEGSSTTFTDPLGSAGQAEVVRKVLLGA